MALEVANITASHIIYCRFKRHDCSLRLCSDYYELIIFLFVFLALVPIDARTEWKSRH